MWTPGSDRVIFAGGEPPNVGLLMQPADASRPPDVLYPGPLPTWPTDVSRDGSTLAFYAAEGLALDDLYVLTIPDRTVRRVVERPGFQRGGRFSPDGRWFAYQSLESGKSEIRVQPWPALDASWVVSQDGGTEPVWSRDGKRLFFRNGSRVMTVDVLSGQSFHSEPPREVLRGDWFSDLYGDQSWDVAADGRFLMMRQAPGSRVRVKVIRNWITEFRASLDSPANRADPPGAR